MNFIFSELIPYFMLPALSQWVHRQKALKMTRCWGRTLYTCTQRTVEIARRQCWEVGCLKEEAGETKFGSDNVSVVIKATHYLTVKITNSVSLFRMVLNKVRENKAREERNHGFWTFGNLLHVLYLCPWVNQLWEKMKRLNTVFEMAFLMTHHLGELGNLSCNWKEA